MAESGLRPEGVAPLLLELARAHRARKFYPAEHPALKDALERTTQVWHDGLPADGELHLEIKKGHFVLPDGSAVRGPGVDDVAGELRMRRVRRLRVHPGLSSQELLALIEALSVHPDDQVNAGGFEQGLIRAGVQHITTSEVDFKEHFAHVSECASEEPEENDDTPPGDALADTSQSVMDQLFIQGEGQFDSMPETGLFTETEEEPDLEPKLAELEMSESYSVYRDIADRIRHDVTSLSWAKRWDEIYEVAVAYARHATDTHREDNIQREAAERLHDTMSGRDMLGYTMELGCSTSGLRVVQATQILTQLGRAAVPFLLEQHDSGDPSAQRQANSILIAMGDNAFPMIVDELASNDYHRERRAIRLLGVMQNPRGVEFLLDKLQDADPEICEETAKALARIGTDRAVHGLVNALEQGSKAAEIAAACLGETRNGVAVRALSQMLDQKSGHNNDVRREALRSLGRIGNPTALVALQKVLDYAPFWRRGHYRNLRIVAAQAIGRIGGPEAVMVLSRYANRGDRAVRKACQEWINRLAGPEEDHS